MSTHTPRIRSLYRRILRELPSRESSQTVLSHPSSLQKQIRATFTAEPSDTGKPIFRHLDEAEQYVQYARAQRMYATLLERYNPGMNMNEEERVRLTARRVGMDLPPEFKMSGGNKDMRRESEYEMVDHNGPQRGAGKRRGGLKEGT
ncbi:hypothetical protein M8818_002349 [Zalaria obscura]|uniref:Uncharacterized protein n=1 Tax=Zalaria obscura TaxID=2024903 RepID=A0ACC3SI29_9PEZI